MPPPPIIVPPPRTANVKVFKDFEAVTRLKLHLLMARLRMGIRAVLAANDGKSPRLERCLKAEMWGIMQHLGIIQLYGFTIQTPFILSDVYECVTRQGAPQDMQDRMRFASVNQEFNRVQDEMILATTRAHSYWWTSANEPEVDVGGLIEITEQHFDDFFNTLGAKEYDAWMTGGIPPSGGLSLGKSEPLPGLAERQPTQVAPPEGNVNSDEEEKPCNQCLKTRDTLQKVLMKVNLLHGRIAAQKRDAEEAAARSCDIVGAYGALEDISAAEPLGIPFRNGKGLPKQFKKLHPKHPLEDPRLEEIRARNLADMQDYNDPDTAYVTPRFPNDTQAAKVHGVMYHLLTVKERAIEKSLGGASYPPPAGPSGSTMTFVAPPAGSSMGVGTSTKVGGMALEVQVAGNDKGKGKAKAQEVDVDHDEQSEASTATTSVPSDFDMGVFDDDEGDMQLEADDGDNESDEDFDPEVDY